MTCSNCPIEVHVAFFLVDLLFVCSTFSACSIFLSWFAVCVQHIFSFLLTISTFSEITLLLFYHNAGICIWISPSEDLSTWWRCWYNCTGEHMVKQYIHWWCPCCTRVRAGGLWCRVQINRLALHQRWGIYIFLLLHYMFNPLIMNVVETHFFIGDKVEFDFWSSTRLSSWNVLLRTLLWMSLSTRLVVYPHSVFLSW